MLELETESTMNYCTDVQDFAQKRRIPAAFATISPQLSLYRDPLNELYWESAEAQVFSHIYEARQYGSVLIYEVHSGASGELKMPFFGISIDVDKAMQPFDGSPIESIIRGNLETYNAGYAKTWQAAWEGLTNQDGVDWIYFLHEQSQSRRKIKISDKTFDRWDVTQVRAAWNSYIRRFTYMIIDGIRLGDAHYFTREELSVLGVCSAEFFVPNHALDMEDIVWQFNTMSEHTVYVE